MTDSDIDLARRKLGERGFKITKAKAAVPLTPHPAALMHEPRIKKEDSHDVIVGPDGKIVYKRRTPLPAAPTVAQVCEAANASDPRRFRR